jgi:hypothetical protein
MKRVIIGLLFISARVNYNSIASCNQIACANATELSTSPIVDQTVSAFQYIEEELNEPIKSPIRLINLL